jgi:hypothetical protein
MKLFKGASGCLLFSFAQDKDGKDGEPEACAITRTLIESMKSTEATKTYLALCDGDGTWNGVNFLEKGWFTLDLKVKDEWGESILYCMHKKALRETLSMTNKLCTKAK